jgi:hypothetical protein
MSAGSLRERVAEVMADHWRGDWSDGTFSCHGCLRRFEDSTQAEWESLTTLEQKREYRERLNAHLKPDWTRDDWNQHLADAVLAEVREWLGSSEAQRAAIEAVQGRAQADPQRSAYLGLGVLAALIDQTKEAP